MILAYRVIRTSTGAAPTFLAESPVNAISVRVTIAARNLGLAELHAYGGFKAKQVLKIVARWIRQCQRGLGDIRRVGKYVLFQPDDKI